MRFHRAASLVFALAAVALLAFLHGGPNSVAPRRLLNILVQENTARGNFLQGSDAQTFLEFLDPLNGKDDFAQWMRNGNVDIHDSTPVSSMWAKVHRRLLLFCYDVLPDSVRKQYSHEMEALNIDWQTPRTLTVTETVIKGAIAASEAVHSLVAWDKESYNYYGFLPHDHGRVIPGKAANTWESPCWKKVSADVSKVADGWELSVSVSGPKKIICSDYYLFATASSMHLGIFPTPIPGTKKYKFSNSKLSASESWDVDNLGVRAFRFRDGPLHLVRNLFETALLFTGEILKSPPAFALKQNVDFLQRYVGISMQDRKDDGGVMLNESEVHSGDFLGIIRLDGLDPMLAWGMGSHTGHTAVAIWEDNQLYIAESTTNGTYWPTNGIQRTPYRQWLTQARAAGYSVVHVPLAEKYRNMFDAKAANAFFHSKATLDYGFSTLLVGWVDTAESNYPCLPPYDAAQDDKFCLSWNLVEVLFPILGKYVTVAEKIFLEAWNQHVTGSPFSGLKPTEIYQAAAKKGVAQADIFKVVEKDNTAYSQVYNNGTKTKDISMVCDVFVCYMWKAAGLFKEIDNDVNCVEQTNSDIYDLSVLTAPAQRPSQCVAADPNNKLCQIIGKYTLELPKVGSVQPYKHMQESCPTEPPKYARPSNC